MSALITRLRALLGAGHPDFALGVRLLAFNRLRLLAALGGIGVAVLVMFVELGLLQTILGAQAGIAKLAQGDLVMMHQGRSNLHDWTRFESIRLAQAAADPDVAEAIALYQGGMLLRNPPDRSVRRVIVFAFPADNPPLAIGDPAAIRAALARSDAVLFDRLSRPLYGPMETGRAIELDGRLYKVAGEVAIGPDIVMDGAVAMSEGAWRAREPDAWPIMGVLRLRANADAAAVGARLARAMPDMAVMTPRQAWWREIWFTFRAAPIGIIFGIGVATGAFIGGIICYQILFNEIFDLKRELSTLRAMGFGEGLFRRLVLEQAYLLAAGGFLAGLLAAAFVYRFLAQATGLEMSLGWLSALVIALPTAIMAHLGGRFALRRLFTYEPADLY
jgi:putative ABC transport system permease protein